MAKFAKEFVLDSAKSVEGVWFEHETEDGTIRLLIASISSDKYKKALTAALKPYKRAVREMDIAKIEPVTRRMIAKHILLGWENLEDDAGNAIAYTSDKAFELMTESPQFFTLVQEYASEASNFKQETLEDAAGN